MFFSSTRSAFQTAEPLELLLTIFHSEVKNIYNIISIKSDGGEAFCLFCVFCGLNFREFSCLSWLITHRHLINLYFFKYRHVFQRRIDRHDLPTVKLFTRRCQLPFTRRKIHITFEFIKMQNRCHKIAASEHILVL